MRFIGINDSSATILPTKYPAPRAKIPIVNAKIIGCNANRAILSIRKLSYKKRVIRVALSIATVESAVIIRV